MAQHLVLDIGNVILAWQPEKLIADCVPDTEQRAAVLTATIGHPDWLELDRGTLALDNAIARAQARIDVEPAWIANVYHQTPPSLEPLPDSIAAMYEVHAAGRALYVLSNMASHSAAYLLETHDCFQLCSGIVMSCNTGHIKPEPAIFDYLCDAHGLLSSDCFFIDDVAANIEGARNAGLSAVQLERPDQGGRLIRDWLASSRQESSA